MIPRCCILCFLFATTCWAAPSDEFQGQVLLDFKANLQDSYDNLRDWRKNSSDFNPCQWSGIGCFGDIVTSINLHGFNLSGSLSDTICRLPYLASFNVSKNFFSGSVPAGLTNCSRLEILDVSTNYLHGEIAIELCSFPLLKKLFLSENLLDGAIPSAIGNLTSLQELVIYTNNLTGTIPSSIRRLKNLRIIRAGLNSISGPIPKEISECDSLEILGLAQNKLVGFLPRELQSMKNLTTLILWQNQLSGPIPSELGNCSCLEMIALNANGFTGPIPPELGKLKMLKRLYLYTNQLSGAIPPEIGNCESAVEIDFSENQLTGFIPVEIARIQTLQLLHLFENLLQGGIPIELGELTMLRRMDLSINNLTGYIPSEFENLTSLEYLQLFDNDLSGKIPPLLGINSNLSVLDLSDNNLSGFIPPNLCISQKLIFLSLGSNSLSGNIPHGLKTCKPLVQLRLGNNQLTGSFPTELSELSNLTSLEMNHNRFSGPIPPDIGMLRSLERLLLSDNYFVGEIPPEVEGMAKLVDFNVSSNSLSGRIPHELANCTELQRLDLSRNLFTGYVPDELGSLVNLELLKLSDNNLNGSLPNTLGGLIRLTELQMGGNLLSGVIPVELGRLIALQIALNISYNAISGRLPSELGNLQMLEALYLNDNKLDGEVPPSFGGLSSLLVCNLSNNDLIGSVPNTPVFQRMDDSNFLGNDWLCGTSTKACVFSPSPFLDALSNSSSKNVSKEKIIIISSSVISSISLVLCLFLCWSLKSQAPSLVPETTKIGSGLSGFYYLRKKKITYQDLLTATGNFSNSAVIGRGACGIVYKAVMPDGGTIAVKKLNSHGESSSTIDSSFRTEISTLGNISHRNIVKLYGFCYHQDSNIILYEYMSNGSLGELLHGNQQGDCLPDWNSRYRIALGAAEGLYYLHCDCKPRIIHRDIKSNNILLDEDMEAHVGDFGLAKLIDMSQSWTMSAVAGSYGYIAPEYAFTMKITEKCDIYSFGVVLLELITGKTPVQPLDQGGDLVNLVRRSLQSGYEASAVFDSRLDLSYKSTVVEISLFLKIALFCTSESPADRPTMKEVIAMMIDARDSASIPPSSPASETPLEGREKNDFTEQGKP